MDDFCATVQPPLARFAAPQQRPRDGIPESMQSTAFLELAGLTATVDEVHYAPGRETPEDRPYAFAYCITIHNRSPEAVTIRARKWVITDAMNHQRVIECDGIFGKFPRIGPGEAFSYKHHHSIATDSHAEGAFFGVTDSGEPVFTRIPAFRMEAPGLKPLF